MPPFGTKICLDISPCIFSLPHSSVFLELHSRKNYSLLRTESDNVCRQTLKHISTQAVVKYSKFLVFSQKMSRKGNFRELKSKTFSGISRGKHAPGPLQKACNFSTHYRIQSSFILLPRSLPPSLPGDLVT